MSYFTGRMAASLDRYLTTPPDDTVECEGCGATVLLDDAVTSPDEDGPDAVTMYFCPDCAGREPS